MSSIISRNPQFCAKASRPSRPSRRSKRKSIFNKTRDYPSDEVRVAQIKLAAEVDAAFAKTHEEIAELDLPSDYNNPEQMMIYMELEELFFSIYGE